MANHFLFEKSQFNRLFPFYILLDNNLTVIDIGNTLQKIFPNSCNLAFTQSYLIKCPADIPITFSFLKTITGKQIIVECLNDKKIPLHGQIEYLAENDELVFLLSPQFVSIEEVIENNLTFEDFACFDPMIDLLHSLKAQEITAKDLKQLLQTVNTQKEELKKDQKELETLSCIIQQSKNAIVITNVTGQIEWVNKSFTINTGFTLSEVFGKTPGSMLQGKDTDKATIRFMREKIRKAEPVTCEILNYNKAGEPHWLRLNIEPIFDKKGKLQQYFGIEEDITKEREVEKKLQEFDIRLNLALQKMGDNVWEHDFLTDQTSFSQKEFELLGYSLDSFKNNVDLWYYCVHNDDKKLLREKNILYRRGLIHHHSLEYRIIDKNGKVKWILDRGVVIEQSNKNTPLKIIGTHTDITKKKSIEKELEASASRMSSLINNLQAGVLLEDADRKISLVNTRFCELFDISMDSRELIDCDCGVSTELSKVKFVNPEEYIIHAEKIFWERKPVIGDKLELLNGRIFKRDFIPIWNKGIYEGALWLFNDITEKINANKKLEDQRIFYEEILDNIPADIAVFDNSHRYLYLNPKAIKDKELRKWMVGKTDEDYIIYRNLPKNILDGRRNIFNAVIQSKQLKSWEEENKQPDGSIIYNMRNMYPVLDEHQEIKIVIGYGLDITNIKTIQQQIEKSEKRYRDVIDNSMAIITTHNLKGDFLTVNPMVGRTFGYEDDDMIGHNITEFMLEEDKLLFTESYLHKIVKEKNANGMFKVAGKNGNIIYTLYNNYLKEEEGEMPYIIGFSIDITDRIKAEKELKVAKQITEELAKTKQNFLANMSHEIRTPMNGIMGMANQLGKTSLDPTQQFYLNTINSASENLLVIINDILDLSKIEAGKLSFESIGFEPQMVIINAMQVLMHRAEEKGIKIINSFLDPLVSKILIGDPYRLNQVMLNLISNAIKFTEQGSIDLTLTVVADNEKSQLVQIQIKDSGIGMEKGFVEHLFDKFSQEYESTSRKYGGTGLGMSICKNLVELMGGNIYAYSAKGSGTVISFEIDFKKGMQNDLKIIDTFVFSKNLLAGKKILVVDDNDMNRLVASTILENYGTEIFEASDGNEAVVKVIEYNPDLILMDLQMPGLNGFEATAVIRKSGNNVPIIALTANAIKGENEKCLIAGMNDYVSKPFKEENLLKTIAKWLEMDTIVKKQVLEEIKKEPEEILYDLANLRAISNGNEAFIKKMISIFCNQTPPMLKDIQEAYQLRNFEKIGAIAHKIKPTIDNLSINSLKQVVRDIETAGKENHDQPRLEPMLHLFKDILDKVMKQMQQEFTDL